MPAAPPLIPFGLAMCAPVLLKFGTDAQKQRFLPRIYHGDDFWCQGYSEPGSGSDLASLRTAAVRQGDHYVVNGQKTWTTLAHMADWIFCLVRTDTTRDKQQEGISFLLIDMRTPGITVRPLVLMDGGHEVNEVFFDDVEVPVENLVHEEGKGWTVAKYLLGHERMNTARIGASKRELEQLKEFAARASPQGGRPLIDDPRFRDKLSRARDRADGARDHEPALPRPAARRARAGRRGVDAEDQGHRDPAGADRADDGGGRPARAAGAASATVTDGFDSARRRARAALLQLSQDHDLRRLERDPAQHHRQARAGL